MKSKIFSSLCSLCPLWLPLFILFSLFCGAAHGVEPWADQNLPVKDGLITWLDATRQEPAWAAHQKELLPNDPLDVFFDASGNARDFSQATLGGPVG